MAQGPDIIPRPDELIPPFHGILVTRFQEPPTPYAAGHRGVDLAAPPGTVVVAAAAGIVTFAGQVAGDLFVTIEVAGPRRVTYSYLGSSMLRQGDRVDAGQLVGTTGSGHPDRDQDSLHFGVRVPDATQVGGWRYVDPMPYLRAYRRRLRVPAVHLVRGV